MPDQPPTPAGNYESQAPLGAVTKAVIVDGALLLYVALAVLFLSQVFARSYDLLDRNDMFTAGAGGDREALNFGDYVYFLFAKGIEHRNLDHYVSYLVGEEGFLADPEPTATAAVGAETDVADAIADDALAAEASATATKPFLIVLIVVVVLLILWTAIGRAGRLRTPAQRLFGVHAPPPPTPDNPPRPLLARFSGWTVILIVLVTLLTGWFMIEVNLTNVFAEARLDRMGNIFTELFDFTQFENNWKVAFDPDPATVSSWDLFGEAVPRMIETVFLAMMATALAIPIAFCLSFFGARNLMRGSPLGIVVYYVVRWVMNVIRSVEPLCWCIVAGVWVGAGTFAGVLALAIHSIAALTKLYSEQIEAIDPGPLEAIRATGAGGVSVLRFGVVPQVVPPFLSFTMYRWDINLRMAPILGFVGGGGIGVLLKQNFDQLNYANVGVIILLITLVVAAMDFTSARIRAKLI